MKNTKIQKKIKKIKKKFIPQINIRKLTKKITSNIDLTYLKLKKKNKKNKKNKKIKNLKTAAIIKAKEKRKIG